MYCVEFGELPFFLYLSGPLGSLLTDHVERKCFLQEFFSHGTYLPLHLFSSCFRIAQHYETFREIGSACTLEYFLSFFSLLILWFSVSCWSFPFPNACEVVTLCIVCLYHYWHMHLPVYSYVRCMVQWKSKPNCLCRIHLTPDHTILKLNRYLENWTSNNDSSTCNMQHIFYAKIYECLNFICQNLNLRHFCRSCKKICLLFT